MVRWIKIFGNQYVGFWILGLILFALQEVPYMVMPLFKLNSDPIMNMREASVALDVLEKVLGILCIVLMTFVVHEEATLFNIGNGINKIGFFLAIIILFLNYIGWGLYFSGHRSFGIIIVFIVILPPLYYFSIGLWRRNWPLLVAGLFFEIVHFAHVYGNIKM